MKSHHLFALVGGGILAAILGALIPFVLNPTSDFKLSVSPVMAEAVQGGTVQTNVVVERIGDYEYEVILSANDSGGAEASFEPGAGRPPYDSQMTVSLPSDAPAGESELRIRAVGGDGTEHSCCYFVVVRSNGDDSTPGSTATPGLSPIPTPTEEPATPAPAVTPAPSPAGGPGVLPESPAVPENSPVSKSDIQISDVFFDGRLDPYEGDEYVTISNLGSGPQDVSGWVLKDVTDGEPVFEFPDYTLEPGEEIMVYTNLYMPGAFSFNYPHEAWDNDDPDTAVLYDADGQEVSRMSY